MSTYLIFNQLRIIHPQFRPKSRSSVLEPSQNFLSNQAIVFLFKRKSLNRVIAFERVKSSRIVDKRQRGLIRDGFSFSILTIVIECSVIVVRARSKEEAICRRGPHKLWLKRATIRLLSYFRRN
ncbi:neurotrimin-like isoform X2 [Vespula maculifrons]|uniref:Neurotrimin-like isoform X2 n=1 Tax=Vespula maculifrons TaxID=7453 RepID=A0ABD2CBY3_VESMC